MSVLRIGIAGLGTVGAGLVRLLQEQRELLALRCGRTLEVTAVSARDRKRDRGVPLSGIAWHDDPVALARDNNLDVVVELIGGSDGVARKVVETAIAAGKQVVTANKALLAHHGTALAKAAEKSGVALGYEAAVAGGIPIIKALREGLVGNRITRLYGILNGTCNYILSTMRESGRDFADVLAEAQALGYAEADPTFDVEGIDAAHKLTILASIAFGIPLQFDKVYTEGITQITRLDVDYAEKLGYRIKHLGIARKTPEGIELRVHPTLIPERRLIANVNGVMNAVLVKGDAVGPTLYYGAGAGADPTASAVVADVIDVTRALTSDPENRVPHLAFQPEAIKEIPILAPDRFKSAYYLRLNAEDKPGVLADVTKILADHQISIEAIIQKEPLANETAVPIILLTQVTLEKEMNEAIAKIEALPTVTGQVCRIRLETLG